MLRLLFVLQVLTLLGAGLQAQSLQVRHDHDPWGDCVGELIINEQGIEFRSDKEDHSRVWKWLDIQSFDRKSSTRFSVLSWEDQKWKLGLDRNYDFTVISPPTGLDEETFRLIDTHLAGPLTDRVPREIDAEYSLPVKHLHTFGGCEGTLYFGEKWIVYDTDYRAHARSWRRDRDIDSFWSANRYRLEIHVFEENQRQFDKTRRFAFQLKQPIDSEYYQKLRREMVPVR